jgi:hypothetical protein
MREWKGKESLNQPFMRFQTLLFGVRFFTLISFGTWMGIFLSVDPESAGMPGAGLFLGALFSFLVGAFTLMLVSLSRRFLGDATAAGSFGASFRQGFLLALLSVAVLVLSRLGYLSWWNALLALATILLVEFTARRLSREE